jgi:alkyl hydroperoxide reductase subunit AhpC
MYVLLKQTSMNCIRDTNPGLFRTVTMNAVCCRWCVLISHPSDFTPVCTTEVGRIAEEASEFFRRGVKLLGHSCDSLQKHRKWLDVSSTQMLVLLAMIYWYVDVRLSSAQFGSFDCGPHINLTRQGMHVESS